MEKILLISLKIQLTPNTLGCYGLNHDLNFCETAKILLDRRCGSPSTFSELIYPEKRLLNLAQPVQPNFRHHLSASWRWWRHSTREGKRNLACEWSRPAISPPAPSPPPPVLVGPLMKDTRQFQHSQNFLHHDAENTKRHKLRIYQGYFYIPIRFDLYAVIRFSRTTRDFNVFFSVTKWRAFQELELFYRRGPCILMLSRVSSFFVVFVDWNGKSHGIIFFKLYFIATLLGTLR